MTPAQTPTADADRAAPGRDDPGPDDIDRDASGLDDAALDTGTPGAPRKRRRRRGGRGRGGTKPEATGGGTGEDAVDVADGDVDGPEGVSPDQDGAAVKAPRAGRTPAKNRKPRTAAKEANPAKEAASAGDGKAMTLEERVAAGGPTRGLRSSRSRTGRDGRRRREPGVTPPRITDKVMVITEHGDRDQIAVLEGSALVQHYVTRTGATSMVGNVYLGRVQNVLPGMEAAFVDIGRGRTASSTRAR